MVGEPGLGGGADVGLPQVALGFLLQVDVRAEQRMDRNGAAAMCRGLQPAVGQPQPAVRPGRQRRVHQPPGRVEHGEIDRGAGIVQVRHKAAQPVWQRLSAAHAGQGGHRYFAAAGGLFERADEQRVRRQFGEDPVAVLNAAWTAVANRTMRRMLFAQ